MDLWKTLACGLLFLVEIPQRNSDIKKKKRKRKKEEKEEEEEEEEEAKLP